MDLCSDCGLCDSRWVAYVRQACAFIHQQFESLERKAHGRSRDLENEDELYFGVSERMFCAQLQQPLEGAQWTGIVSTLGVRALEQNLVDAVLCVQQSPEDRFTPCRCWPHARRSGRAREQAHPLQQPFGAGAIAG